MGAGFSPSGFTLPQFGFLKVDVNWLVHSTGLLPACPICMVPAK